MKWRKFAFGLDTCSRDVFIFRLVAFSRTRLIVVLTLSLSLEAFFSRTEIETLIFFVMIGF